MRTARIFLGTLVIALVAMSVVPAMAQSQSSADLNALARYFPADTAIFVSMRTDDEFIETIDSVVDRIQAAVPTEDADETLADALDELTQTFFPGGTFEEDLRPLLGNTASFGITSIENLIDDTSSNDEDTPAVVALSIADSAAVLDAIINAAGAAVQQETGEGYVRLTPSNPGSGDNADDSLILRDDVLLYFNTENDLAEAGGIPDGDLYSDADFGAAFDALPEPSYNATLYLDLEQFIGFITENNNPALANLGPMYDTIYSAFGAQVWGFTILGGDSPTIDVASQIGDLSVLEEAGLGLGPTTPFDPAFAAHVPADVPLAIFGNDLRGSLEASTGSFRLAMEQSAAMDSSFDPREIEQGLKQANQMFTQLTGLDFEQDVASWLTGNYALFISLNPDFDTSSQFGIFQTFPVEFGFAVEATDPAQAQATVAGLTQAIQTGVDQMSSQSSDAEVAITSEDIANADVTVVTITAENLPYPVELLMGANDEAFALGTRAAVTSILSPDGGLPSNAEYTRTSSYILPNAVSVAWLNTEGLLPLADLAAVFGQSSDADEQAEDARAALGLFSSGTVSTTLDENGNSLSRFVLTFAE
jgi:hypothetical protein